MIPSALHDCALARSATVNTNPFKNHFAAVMITSVRRLGRHVLGRSTQTRDPVTRPSRSPQDVFGDEHSWSDLACDSKVKFTAPVCPRLNRYNLLCAGP